jgi:hypothetical protein
MRWQNTAEQGFTLFEFCQRCRNAFKHTSESSQWRRFCDMFGPVRSSKFFQANIDRIFPSSSAKTILPFYGRKHTQIRKVSLDKLRNRQKSHFTRLTFTSEEYLRTSSVPFVLQSWQEEDAAGVHHGDVLAGRTALPGLVLRGFSLLRVHCSRV